MELSADMLTVLLKDHAFRSALADRVAAKMCERDSEGLRLSILPALAEKLAARLEADVRQTAVQLVEPTVRRLLAKDIGEASALIASRLAKLVTQLEASNV